MRTKFDEFVSRCQSLVKKHARERVEDWSEIKPQIMNMLSPKQGSKMWKSRGLVNATQTGKVTIRTILMSSMMRHVFCPIMEDPFNLAGHCKDEARGLDIRPALRYIQGLDDKGECKQGKHQSMLTGRRDREIDPVALPDCSTH